MEDASKYLKITKPIVLVGMMGVGKTTFGKNLAAKLNLEFFDVDQEIENDIGHAVSWIFENAGEAEFRKLEHDKIREILGFNRPLVLALGGGAFINDASRELIKKTAISIWLDASVDTIFERVSARRNRPLLEGEEDKLTRIKNLLTAREVYYKQADIRVSTDGSSHRHVLERIMDKLGDLKTKIFRN